ncbi:hypothetical protein [Rahnella inusitata]|uniref:hypothetical protein n=1 Tax=Rahnella inusitata TaxID=58169 RepID=UPI0039B0173F
MTIKKQIVIAATLDTAAICLIVNERLTRNIVLHQLPTCFAPCTLSGTVIVRSIPYIALFRGETGAFGYKKQRVCRVTFITKILYVF